MKHVETSESAEGSRVFLSMNRSELCIADRKIARNHAGSEEKTDRICFYVRKRCSERDNSLALRTFPMEKEVFTPTSSFSRVFT